MSSLHPPSRRDGRAHRLVPVAALGAAGLLLLLGAHRIAWTHWAVSTVVVAAALAAVVVAEATWQRAITTAESAGLVARSAADPTRFDADGVWPGSAREPVLTTAPVRWPDTSSRQREETERHAGSDVAG